MPAILKANTKYDNRVVQSPNDTRKYRLIVLDNGMKALLVSDIEPEVNPSSESSQSADEQSMKGTEKCSSPCSPPRSRQKREEKKVISSSEEDSEEDTDASDMELDPIEEKLKRADKLAKKRQNSQDDDREKLAAAALCVAIGSFSDSPEVPGLAHFLEHMVFMGSEKYPDENAFDSFVKKHGGGDNAYTDCERTVFYFDIQRKNFHEALDIFAQFFISPLMKTASVDREIKAVDSEFEMSRQSDSARRQQLLGHLARKGSPMSKFMWGNEESLKLQPERLGVNPYKHLQEFHDKYYSAHFMTLAVQAKETLDTLEQWVKEIFSPVPNNKQKAVTFTHERNLFDTPEFTRLYQVVPVKNTHQLEINWNIPQMRQHYKSKPLHYVGWLTGHEGKGSVLSYLRNKLWALSISSGNSESGWEHNSTGAMFSVVVTLTDQGLENVFEVMTVVFEYMDMLRSVCPQKRVYDEIKIIEDNEFRWKDKSDPSDYVEHLAEAMQTYEPEHYLNGDSVLFEFRPQLINEVTSRLLPDNCNIIISSKKYENTLTQYSEERWYKTKYKRQEIPAEYIDKWKKLKPRSELCLPTKNDYIATDFDLRPKNAVYTKQPTMISCTPHCQVWYKQDSKFKVPKGFIYLHLISPAVCQSARSQAMFDLFQEILSHNLQEVLYAAHVAQLEYEFKTSNSGLTIKLNGFSHKLHKLFETIVDHISNFTVPEDLFKTLVTQLKKKYYNQFIKPDRLARELRLRILEDKLYTVVDKRQFLSDLTRQELMSFIDEFKKLLFVKGYVHGNFAVQDAHSVDSYIKQKLTKSILPEYMHPADRVYRLPEAELMIRTQTFNESDNNSCIVNYYQSGPVSIREYVKNELLCMMMDEPCFDILRTREQLGYQVSCSAKNTDGIIGISIGVTTQASKFSVQQVDEKIEDFIHEFKDRLDKFDDEEFVSQRQSLIAIKQCDDSHMGEEVDRMWLEVQDDTFLFNRLDQEVDELEVLTLDEIKAWFSGLLNTDGNKRKKLSVQVVGFGETEVNDYVDFPASISMSFADQSLSNSMKSDARSMMSTGELSDNKDDINYNYKFLSVDKNLEPNYQQIINITEFRNSLSLYPVSKIKPVHK